MLVKNRIKKHKEFQEVIAKGELIRSNFFTFYVLENKLGYTRIGISVPKKSGTAVVRNKIKRQVRSMCAKNTDYSKSIDLVMIIKKAYNTEKFAEIEQDIQEIFKK